MPEEIEDIFAESAPTPEPKPEKKVASLSAPTPMVEVEAQEEMLDVPEEIEPKRRFPWKLIIIIAAVIIIIGGLGAGGFFYYQNIYKPSAERAAEKEAVGVIDITQVGENGEEVITGVVIVDTDFDGLSDEEEGQYNTSVKSADSDNDGLTDREEIRVYLTDPLNPDSDEDNYSDGEEVINGFNPMGKGPLLDLEEEINKINK
ncbi:thrombospondin type 3 repeat-containing protein [Patescibacteria group bacterium]|nr:thrombospondin type 3 repeat-containing protein [Patescibacteria group bacterium]MBU1672963.1 thrombospondin type 3 repeat-containing protein [Patescibacteria group bacterium]MBU1963002.1 thrombospondin type 3 repeat-containing protein [Patescibacteria group bacterium]